MLVLLVLQGTLLGRQARLPEGLLADVVSELARQLVVAWAGDFLVLVDPAPESGSESSDQGVLHL